MSQFPIYFGTFLPKLPPALPAERKYWVTVVTKDSSGETVGPTPRPVTVTYKACTSEEECSEGYFCDPDTRSCEEIEVFCAGKREIPGYKGTGFSKPESGNGLSIQGTDGSAVVCTPYRCKSLPDGTPYCTNRCESTADCDVGHACTSDGICVYASGH